MPFSRMKPLIRLLSLSDLAHTTNTSATGELVILETKHSHKFQPQLTTFQIFLLQEKYKIYPLFTIIFSIWTFSAGGMSMNYNFGKSTIFFQYISLKLTSFIMLCNSMKSEIKMTQFQNTCIYAHEIIRCHSIFDKNYITEGFHFKLPVISQLRPLTKILSHLRQMSYLKDCKWHGSPCCQDHCHGWVLSDQKPQ